MKVIVIWTFVISYTFWLLLATAESLRALELELLGSRVFIEAIRTDKGSQVFPKSITNL